MRSTTNWLLLASVFVGTAAHATDSSPAVAIGIVLKARGATRAAVSPGSSTNARVGDILFAGDRLLSAGEPISFVYCPEKVAITLAGGSAMTLRADGVVLSAGRISERKPVASCFMPRMVRVIAASQQQFGSSVVRGKSDRLAARLQAMTEARRGAFLSEWMPVETTLLRDPRNKAAQKHADELLAKFEIPAEELDQVPALESSPALTLWRVLVPLVALNRADAALREIAKSPEASADLYRELLFDAVDSLLGPSAPVSPLADKVRALLAKGDQRGAALEAQFARWKQDRTKSFGGGSPVADLVSAYVEVFSISQPKTEQYQAILDASCTLGVELAEAAAWSNLSASAVQEGRSDEARPLLGLAEMAWRGWNHAGGMMIADYLAGRIDAASGKLEPALREYERAAKASEGVPEMRQFRLDVLAEMARVKASLVQP